MTRELPVIDMAKLFDPADTDGHVAVAKALARACEIHGFFYLTGHGVELGVLEDLETESRKFFALPLAEKMKIAMVHGGRAWRGYFPVGGELTSGQPDLKEGLYLGSELALDDPRVAAGVPMHGANLWPIQVPGLQDAVAAYMAGAVRAASLLMKAFSISLDLEPDYFARSYTGDPTVLFRIFHYPASPKPEPLEAASWGVGEHTDYGLLTLLAQDHHGGLQVRTPTGWIEAPPISGALVCNIGDMLERLTVGRFRSTPHRVLNRSGKDRLSFPLFFDPDFTAQMKPLPIKAPAKGARAADRWDKANPHTFEGTYGDYLLSKVGKVFPQLVATLD